MVKGISFFQLFYATKPRRRVYLNAHFNTNWTWIYVVYLLSVILWDVEFLSMHLCRISWLPLSERVLWLLFEPYFFRLVVPEFSNLSSAMHNTFYSFSLKFSKSCSLILRRLSDALWFSAGSMFTTLCLLLLSYMAGDKLIENLHAALQPGSWWACKITACTWSGCTWWWDGKNYW